MPQRLGLSTPAMPGAVCAGRRPKSKVEPEGFEPPFVSGSSGMRRSARSETSPARPGRPCPRSQLSIRPVRKVGDPEAAAGARLEMPQRLAGANIPVAAPESPSDSAIRR